MQCSVFAHVKYYNLFLEVTITHFDRQDYESSAGATEATETTA